MAELWPRGFGSHPCHGDWGMTQGCRAVATWVRIPPVSPIGYVGSAEDVKHLQKRAGKGATISGEGALLVTCRTGWEKALPSTGGGWFVTTETDAGVHPSKYQDRIITTDHTASATSGIRTQ